jgi:hypothetical protein
MGLSGATLDGNFWLIMAGIVFGAIAGIGKLCYKSKCKRVGCCCLQIERDIAAEEHEDIEAMQRGIAETPNSRA